MAAGQFEIYKDAEGAFRWRLKTADGGVIANSDEGYPDAAFAAGHASIAQDAAAGAKFVYPPDE